MIIIVVIALLSGVVLYLNVVFYRQNKIFKSRIQTLERIIMKISKEQSNQSNQLRISDEFQEGLRHKKITLSQDVFKLNYELFEMLSKHDLLKK